MAAHSNEPSSKIQAKLTAAPRPSVPRSAIIASDDVADTLTELALRPRPVRSLDDGCYRTSLFGAPTTLAAGYRAPRQHYDHSQASGALRSVVAARLNKSGGRGLSLPSSAQPVTKMCLRLGADFRTATR